MTIQIDAPRFHKEFCPAAVREQLILRHLAQVQLIARRIHEKMPASVNFDDLVSAGIVGLIAAIDRYDPEQGVKLKTYAEFKIRGAILDSLREMDWATRQQRLRARQIEGAIAKLEQELNREPATEEIADRLGVTLDRYHEWLQELHGLSLGRLDNARDEDGQARDKDRLKYMADDSEQWPSRIVERSELQRVLLESIESMPPLERTVLSLYFYDEMTLRQIGKVVDLHESRVSQLKARGLLRLRASLTKCWPRVGEPCEQSTAA